MSQTARLVRSVKRALKARGKTYVDVGRALNLSVASVKRLFASQNLTLRRLERLCDLLEMDFAELARMTTEPGAPLRELSDAQEREIASDERLLLVAVSALNRWSAADIAAHYAFDAPELTRHLARLDRLKLIELQPANRIRVRVAANFRWRTDGPIQRFFQNRVAAAFFASRFADATERLLVCNGMLTDTANGVVQRAMERLVREFGELNAEDAERPLSSRNGTTLVLAIRRWEYPPFGALRRTPRPRSGSDRA